MTDERMDRLVARLERAEAFVDSRRGRAALSAMFAPVHVALARRAWKRGRTKQALYWVFVLGADWETVHAELRAHSASRPRPSVPPSSPRRSAAR